MTNNTLQKPTLIIDPDICKANIRRMSEKAKKQGVIFRPHFKTHQSARIGEWFRAEGVNCITVSSVTMAAYFANHDWEDITIAIPVNLREINEINQLSSSIALNILLESPETAAIIAENTAHRLGYFIEIDTGYHRTGVNPDDLEMIREIIRICNRNGLLEFKGFLTHAGQTYQAENTIAIKQIYEECNYQLNGLYQLFSKEFPSLSISWGDTPSCSLMEEFKGIHEIRPGNFVFYDLMQMVKGICSYRDIALTLACPVIAKYPQRGQIVIYGGAIHLSKDFLMIDEKPVYGLVAKGNGKQWGPPDRMSRLTSISQEHGVIHTSNNALLESIAVGDLLHIYPVHSCLTSDIQRTYLTAEGDIIDCMNR